MVSRTKSSKRKERDDDLPLLKWKKAAARATAARPPIIAPRSAARDERRPRFFGRVWNLIIGLALLPFCWIFTEAIVYAFAHAAPGNARLPFWKTHEFLMFSAGAAIWLVWFGLCLWIWRQPRPLTLYVWGHELMHVLIARIFGGRIKDYEISRDGGYIVTDRYNFLIALAPYLWPFASVPVLAIWGIFGSLPEAFHHREWFLGALGLTWMFHLSFTAWMIPIGQTDFAGPGRVFSLGLIYLANVILLSACLVSLAPEVTWRGYSRELSHSAIAFYENTLRVGSQVLRGAGLM